MRMLIALLALCLATAGCAQSNAGLSSWDIEVYENAKGELYPCKLKIRDGKERAHLAISGNVKTGEFSYVSIDTKAFEGQAIRAEVEKVLIEAGIKKSSDLGKKLLRLLVPLG